MKRLKLLLWLGMGTFGSLAYAQTANNRKSKIAPASSTSAVTIAAAGASIRNCISDIDVTSDAQATFRILTGNTTSYAMDISSGGAIVRSWDDPNSICGSSNQAVYLTVSAGNYKLNYGGFTY